MLLTTTTVIDGKQIVNYHGLVSGEAILGANIFRDLFAGIRDIVGGRSAAYEKELRAREGPGDSGNDRAGAGAWRQRRHRHRSRLRDGRARRIDADGQRERNGGDVLVKFKFSSVRSVC